jgi:hypothetical protein
VDVDLDESDTPPSFKRYLVPTAPDVESLVKKAKQFETSDWPVVGAEVLLLKDERFECGVVTALTKPDGQIMVKVSSTVVTIACDLLVSYQ